jgi:hypothetical protein
VVQSLYSGKTASSIHWIGGWMDPRAVLDTLEKEIYLPLLEIENRFLCHQTHTFSIPLSFQFNVFTVIIT